VICVWLAHDPIVGLRWGQAWVACSVRHLSDHLAALLPELAALLPELGPASGIVDRLALAALRDAFVGMAGRQPTVVFLDDQHWGDEATLELLPSFAGPAEDCPLLFLAAYQSDDVVRGHPLRRMRAGFAAGGWRSWLWRRSSTIRSPSWRRGASGGGRGRGSCSGSSSVPRAERMPGRVEHHPAFSCGWCAPGDAPGPGASPSSPADPQARRPARRPDRVRELTDRSRLLVPVDQVVQEVNGFLRLGRVLPLRQLGPAIRQDQHLRPRLARVGRVLIALDGDRSCHQGIVKAYELRQGGGNRWRSIELQARCQRPSGSRARRRAHALISPLSATIGGS